MMRNLLLTATAAALVFVASGAQAQTFSNHCGSGSARCALEVRIDGALLGQQTWRVDPDSGEASLDQAAFLLRPDGSYASVDFLYGSAGRSLGFYLSAGAATQATFSFLFAMPHAAGDESVHTEVSYALTAVDALPGSLTPIGSHVFSARGIGSAGGPTDLGVDVGDSFDVGGSDSRTSPVFARTQSLTANPALTDTLLRIDFALTGNTTTAVFGQIAFAAVPEPSPVALLALGLTALWLIGRRRTR